jgi:AP-2 complex subunit sigma-1
MKGYRWTEQNATTRVEFLMIRYILVQNRQGKTRLAKWYITLEDEEKQKLKQEVHKLVASREGKSLSNFVEFRNHKIVYRRYAGLYFCFCVDTNDNELSYLESIHLFVEVLDSFFKNVCELDLVFNVQLIDNSFIVFIVFWMKCIWVEKYRKLASKRCSVDWMNLKNWNKSLIRCI